MHLLVDEYRESQFGSRCLVTMEDVLESYIYLLSVIDWGIVYSNVSEELNKQFFVWEEIHQLARKMVMQVKIKPLIWNLRFVLYLFQM